MRTKQDERDAEVEAQLMSKDKEDDCATSRENFDFDYDYSDRDGDGDGNDAYSYWPKQYSASSRLLWRRLRSMPVPNWLPVRKLSQVNPRFLLVVFAVSLAVTALIVNPYSPLRPSQVSSEPTPTTEELPVATETAVPTPELQFCTTWPVDQEGNYDLASHDRANHVVQHSIAPKGGWQKPGGFKIIAMVFFGRKRYVDILDCYLRQNLAAHGGYLDEVWFMVHTEDEDDIAWLNALVAENQGYRVMGQEDCKKNDAKYGCLWKYATASHTMYIKLDDDIVYIHPDAIPQLVHTRLAVPHAFGVSAHLVNSPITGMEQFHHNVIYPFVPDPNHSPRHKASETWRLSELDRYPEKKLYRLRNKIDRKIIYPDVPYPGHPFVLLSEDNFDLLHTSMGRYDQNPGGDFIAFSPVWKSWAMGAQQQYSLLYNLEKNQISRYFFGQPATYPANAIGPHNGTNATVPVWAPKQGQPVLGGEQIFDTQFRRYNLNFCAVWGSDIKKHLPMDDDDEDAITHSIPKKTGRPFIIDTRAVVGHFSFYTQSEEMRQTDLLDRWRAFANEAVCKPDNLKKPWDTRCPLFED
ncbi:hypothetical protein NUW58_g4615 [Xylaria curta]|uniref:Uncharacterized protein n=1 Tax=Xylaria curta TaxID=42375 RepID=A0ACC1P6X2_9PEZI|nr:hypothetical protein NUW58_g4615 [Xylaria curta]